MSDMRRTCAAIAEKYKATKPPADWPCYGDDVVFTDECNGKKYRGTVLRMHPFSPCGAYVNAIWVVQVNVSLDTGEVAVDKIEWSVKFREINQIIRKETPGGQ